MTRRILVVAALLIASVQVHAAATPASRQTVRFVLAAGANDGGTDRVRLRYAVTDARNFADVMAQMGGVDEGNRTLLDEPDRAGFTAALERLAERVSQARAQQHRTEVMLYYSGHADEQGLLLGQERFGYRDLRQMLDQVDADVRIAVLDACASGAITRIKGGQRRTAFTLDMPSDTRGYAFLTSSSAQESAQESDRIGASYFTHYLVTGMRGAADVTADGRVTLSEAYQFAFDETLARTVELSGGTQHPAYDMNLSGSGDIVLTDVRRVSAALRLEDDVEGRLFVRSDDRRLVAELYKAAGRSVELGLEPDEYDIYLEQSEVLSVARRGLADGEHLRLAAADFTVTPREEAVARGGPFLAGVGAPIAAQPAGRYRVEFHFGGIGPEPEAHRLLAASLPVDEATVEDSRFTPLVESVTQVQPWGALSGLTLGYAPTPSWEVVLSWSALTSDVDEDLVNGTADPRTLQQVRLTSVLLGARWYPLATRRVRPFAALSVGTFEGREEGVQLLDGKPWSENERSLGTQWGAGVDVDLTRSLTVGTHLSYNWMGRFDRAVGGRRDYRGFEFRLAGSWRFGS